MEKLEFDIVDVFAETRFSGNPLAVFKHAKDTSADLMQKIAREMNLSETTFILSDEARDGGFDVRIFTPLVELPFAGHPVLGTAYIIQRDIIKSPVERIHLNLEIGRIRVALNYSDGRPDLLWMAQKPPVFGDRHKAAVWARMLGLGIDEIDGAFPIQEVSTGGYSFIVPLKSLAALKKIRVRLDQFLAFSEMTRAKTILAFTRETHEKENDLHVRFFAHRLGVPEDPATGSANGCLAAYLAHHRYFGTPGLDARVEQGHEIRRPSILRLKAEEQGGEIRVEVGGRVIPTASGTLFPGSTPRRSSHGKNNPNKKVSCGGTYAPSLFMSPRF